MSGTHPDEERLLAAALGEAAPDVRDAVGEHLAACPACRRGFEELAAGIELALPAVPRVAPAPGFEARVLQRLGPASGAAARAGGSGARPLVAAAVWRRRVALVALAAGLAGLGTGAGIAHLLDGAADQPGMAGTSPAQAALVTAEGSRVGTVTRSGAGGAVALVVEVHGETGAQLTCRLVLGDGTRRDVATWRLRGDGSDVWELPTPVEGVRAVELVTPSGSVWSAAAL